jgi:hypothetical protein
MDGVLRNLTELCYVFTDDVLLFADTIEEHARPLEKVLQRFEKANIAAARKLRICANASKLLGLCSVTGQSYSFP